MICLVSLAIAEMAGEMGPAGCQVILILAIAQGVSTFAGISLQIDQLFSVGSLVVEHVFETPGHNHAAYLVLNRDKLPWSVGDSTFGLRPQGLAEKIGESGIDAEAKHSDHCPSWVVLE